VRRSIQNNVRQRVAANRARIVEAREREEREAEMIRLLNQKKEQTKP
jgi:hypothetical protein